MCAGSVRAFMSMPINNLIVQLNALECLTDKPSGSCSHVFFSEITIFPTKWAIVKLAMALLDAVVGGRKALWNAHHCT